ncbi:MAG: ATP-binding protein [Firmicutes bacterium]|nr:ATP-binding protein [Bacillota bacterium]
MYADSLQHIKEELKHLDLRILLLLGQQSRPSGSQADRLRGLVISDEEAYRLIKTDIFSPAPGSSDKKTLHEMLAQVKKEIQEKRAESRKKGVFLPLEYLSAAFSLTPLEEQCLVVCLAAELDMKYQKLYGFLHDDMTRKRPTVDLVLNLLCETTEEKLLARRCFSPDGILMKYFLTRHDGAGSGMLSKELCLGEDVVSFLLGSSGLTGAVSNFAELEYPYEELGPLLWGQGIQDNIKKVVQSVNRGEYGKKQSIVFYLYGPKGAGKKLQARHFSKYLNQTLLLVDLRRVLEKGQDHGELLETLGRDAVFQGAVPAFFNFQALLTDHITCSQIREDLFRFIKTFTGVFFLLADRPWKPEDITEDYHFVDIELNVPPDAERKRLWEVLAGEGGLEANIDWGDLAAKFRFTPGQIKNAVVTANNMLHRDGRESDNVSEIIHKACYAQVSHNLEQMATLIRPVYSLDDVILPDEQKKHLKNACNQVKYRHIVYGQWGFDRKLAYGKGLSILFFGPSGTGKTMSAQAVAKELHMELYKINLARTVSKYIGETEKNLQQVFDEAQRSNAILFFDETDALLGKRSEVKDSRDRYSNIEVAFLLQKIEEFEGITMLATNLIQNIDEAFMRRINFIIKYPFPDARHREKIWRSVFPAEAPVSQDLDFEFLAEKLEITGGGIKNVAVSAAFLAAGEASPITMEQVIQAAKYELGKTGKILLSDDLGEYNYLINK